MLKFRIIFNTFKLNKALFQKYFWQFLCFQHFFQYYLIYNIYIQNLNNQAQVSQFLVRQFL